MHTLDRFLRSFVSVTAMTIVAGSAQCGAAQLDPLHAWGPGMDATALDAWTTYHLGQEQKEIARLLAVTGPRTMENTLRPYDQAQAELLFAAYQTELMSRVHPDKAMRDKANELTQVAQSATVELSLNPAVYRALAAIDLSRADAATRHYVEHTLLEYRLAGVDRDDATRARVRQLADRATELGLTFSRNINESVNKVVVRSSDELAGLPADYIARHPPAADGSITLTTNFPDFTPVMSYASDADLRQRMNLAYTTRAYPANKQVLLDLLQTRQDMASTLGFKTWAEFATADKMIRSPANTRALLDQLDRASQPAAEREYAMVLKFARSRQPDLTEIGAASSTYWYEQFRRDNFAFDSQSVRPYFPYARVEQGILDVAAKFFEVRFVPARSAKLWDPSVKAWDVIDNVPGGPRRGKTIGRVYLDMHPRDGKDKWFNSSTLVQGIRGELLPESALICNFPGGEPGDPGLMEYQDVVTFFHEFGHLMHAILGGHQQWSGISGIATEDDFVEAPSQMLEELIRNPDLLRTFARHYRTNAPIPTDVVARMNRASAFGRATGVRSQLRYAQFSLDVHERPAASVDLDAINQATFARYLPYTWVDGNRMYASFGHLTGYTSNVYTYMFDKVIAIDFFDQFKAGDPLRDPSARRYRRTVLEPGGSMPANDLVKNFLGRPQDFVAFERWMGEEFAPAPTAPTRH
jgi:thimet oligopeptidase